MTIQESIQIQDGAVEAFRSMADAAERLQEALTAVKRASRNIVDAAGLQKARDGFTQAQDAAEDYTQSVEKAKDSQKGLSQETLNSFKAASDLSVRLRSAFDRGIEKAQELMAISDKMTQVKSQLGVVVDDGGSVDELQQKLYHSAQRSRSNYMDVADVVTKMSLRAGDAFAGNDEAIQFAENLNKQFAIAGATQEETRSVSLQLAQALGTGAVNSEALNAMFKAAPNAVQTIAEHLGTSIEGVREMAAEGQLSAAVVKDAMLSATDSIDQQFNAMPMTWEQMWTSMQNNALMIFEPLLQKVNELANSEEMQQFLALLPGLFARVADAAMGIFDAAVAVANFIQDNWSNIAPIVMGIVTALLIYKIVSSTILAIHAIMATINPFVLVLAGVIALITLLVLLAEYIIGIIYWVGALGKNIGLWIADLSLAIWAAIQNVGIWFANLGLGIWGVLCACAENVRAAFLNVWKEIQIKFWGFVEAVLQGVAWIADKINSLLGVFGIKIDTSGLEGQIQSLADKQKALEGEKLGYRDIGEAWDKGFHTFDYKDVGDAFHTFGAFQEGWGSEAYGEGAQIGSGIKDWIGGLIDQGSWDFGDSDLLDYSGGGGGGTPLNPYEGMEDLLDAAGGVAGGADAGAGLLGSGEQLAESRDRLADSARNTGDTAENTARMADSLEASEEELKLIREIAERQAINKFTTAEVKIDMTGMTNKIESGEDIDGFLSQFTVKLEDALYATAEGVHV